MASASVASETATVTVAVPHDLVALLGSPEAVADRMRRAFLIDLLREGRISRGRVAELLGIDMWDMLDLIAEYRILSGPSTPEEAMRDIEVARQAMIER